MWSDVDMYRKRLSLYTERLTADVTDGFSRFLNSLNMEVRTFLEKHREHIESTVMTNLDAIDANLRIIYNKVTWSGASS